MNTLALDPNELCNPNIKGNTIDLAMADWSRTNSPLAYWSKRLTPKNYMNYMRKYKIPIDDLQEGYVKMSYGMAETDALEICRQR